MQIVLLVLSAWAICFDALVDVVLQASSIAAVAFRFVSLDTACIPGYNVNSSIFSSQLSSYEVGYDQYSHLNIKLYNITNQQTTCKTT
jgi:hypothetical protein